MSDKNWMSAINSPIRYRVGNQRLHVRLSLKTIMAMLGLVAFLAFIFIYLAAGRSSSSSSSDRIVNKLVYEPFEDGVSREYNPIYPLTPPTVNAKDKTVSYRLMAVADLDTDSKRSESKYVSYLLSGRLTLAQDFSTARVEFDAESIAEISSEYAYGGRGMELSDLAVFNGRLYACDDRTGILFEICLVRRLALPWTVLVDGDGRNTSKGFKCEWMTVRERKLYVGGLGKEWTTANGEFVNHNPQWIKVVGHLGDVSHVDWHRNYNALRAPGGFNFPGYMIFESAAWSPTERRWYFLPRRASRQSYDEKLDERRAANLMLTADETFSQVSSRTIGEVLPVRGYSSFKFVPNSGDKYILALKTEENDGQTRTFVTLFNVDGSILVNDLLISSKFKFEGIEFV